MRRDLGGRSTRAAYTFMELLTVIAIIGILVALLLPAVQAAREAARRNSCTSNLSQLAIAVQQYEMVFGVYPPGTINNARPIFNRPKGYHHNWILQLLPYLEQKNTYAHVNRATGVYDRSNAAVRRVNLKVLRCPTLSSGGKAYSDYAGVHNDVEAPIDIDNNGVFFLNRSIGYEDLVDGSSNTFFFGEKLTIAGDLGWMSGTRATLRNTGVPINYGGSRSRFRVSPSLPPGSYPPGVGTQGMTEPSAPEGEELLGALFGDPGILPWGDLSAGSPIDGGMPGGSPIDANESQEPPIFKRPTVPLLAVGGFGSEHAGGAQFVLGDGSVQFISETVNPVVFMRLGNRADRSLRSGDGDY